jgi:FkbH-like protein
MSIGSDFYADLAWLPKPTPEIRDALASLAKDIPRPGGAVLRRIAGYGLSDGEANRLLRVLKMFRKANAAIDGLSPFRLGILSNGTTDFVASAIQIAGVRWGFDISVVNTPFNQVVQEAFEPASKLNSAKVEAVLLAIDHRGMPFEPRIGDARGSDAVVEACIRHVADVAAALAANSGAIPILQTLPALPERLFGHFDRKLSGTRADLIDRINRGILDLGNEYGWPILDVASLAATVGLACWHDMTQWAWAKLPFSQRLVPLYADHVARVVAALRGKVRKVLVLDCDNTLWSGVIGDDGLDGIMLGPGSAAGEVFLDFQRYALEMRDRGIVLAVSSKNDDAVARRVFREHPEMLLRENHVAVFQVNWDDKASNLKSIADTLSLGLDSLVFVDDNLFERELVRNLLPQVAVPEVGEDASQYAQIIAAAGYFEAVGFSAEDRRRADFYGGNAERAALERSTGGLESYLKSLRMRITFSPFDRQGRVRIAQLINKTNQFNLTTRRYTEQEVAGLEADPLAFTLQVRVVDSLGDNGMISVIICRKADDIWEIETWLMSCRVLRRRIEEAVLYEIVRNAAGSGARELRAWYLPTDRNSLVLDHYRNLGFTQIESLPNGATLWKLDLAAFHPGELPFSIERVEQAATAEGSLLVAVGN